MKKVAIITGTSSGIGKAIAKYYKEEGYYVVGLSRRDTKENVDESIETKVNNIKVSGTGSEVFKLALHYVHKYILSRYADVYVVNRVHDAVYLDAPDKPELYTKIAVMVTLCFQKAWFEIIKNAALTDVPMPCDAGVGSNMAGIEYEFGLDFTTTLEPYFMLDRDLEVEIERVANG